MTKTFLLIAALAIAFSFGFAFHSAITSEPREPRRIVTGIGGIFFKCKDPNKLKDWYHDHLGINTGSYGATFQWYQGADSTRKGFSQWAPFKETTKYFDPSLKDFMINYRVQNMTTLVPQLRQEGVIVLDSIETYDYGKFVHIMDIEGNKIELWEPNDVEYAKIGGQLTK